MSGRSMDKKPYGGLIAVSGIDGCGKSTLRVKIGQYLRKRGIEAVESSAISDHATTMSRQIGRILRDTQTEDPLPPAAEHALIIAARCIAETNVIEPALSRGAWVVSDRYSICGSIYQRGNNGIRIGRHQYQSRLRDFGLTREPDLEVVVDIDPKRPHKVYDAESNRLEDRSIPEWETMRLLYQRAAWEKSNTMLVNGHLTPNAIFDKVKPKIDSLINKITEQFNYRPQGSTSKGEFSYD